MRNIDTVEDVPPSWLPSWLDGIWTMLASYPILLSLVIASVGLAVAGLVRSLILYWGLKVTRRSADARVR